MAHAQTWLLYKHHNTAKYLIGISPQGIISYISNGCRGGCVGDKYITEHYGILSKLLPGDLVIADRGFDVQDSVGMVCAKVAILNLYHFEDHVIRASDADNWSLTSRV